MRYERPIRILSVICVFILITLTTSLTTLGASEHLIEKAEPVVRAQLAESLSITGVSDAQRKLHVDGSGVGILVVDDWNNLHAGAPHGEAVVDIIRAAAPEANVWICKLDFTLAMLHDFTGCLLEMDERNLDVDIVNMSFSMGDKFYKTACGTDLTEFGRAIHRYAEDGIIFVAASGNQGNKDGLKFPACHSDVISVAATYDADGSNMVFQSSEFSCKEGSKLDKITCYSNVAPYLDLLAPGTIVSTPSNSRFGGTSAAAPVVTGIVALMLSQDPNLTKSSILRTLRDTGKSIYDGFVRRSFSRVNALGAIEHVVAASGSNSTATSRSTSDDDQEGITISEQGVANFDFDRNGQINDVEFFDAVEAWIRQSISNALFFELVDAWTSKAVVASGERPIEQAVVMNSTPTAVYFTGQSDVTRGSLEIYNTQGQLAAQQQESGNSLRWNLHNNSGKLVANGVYIYVVHFERNGKILSRQGKVSVIR